MLASLRRWRPVHLFGAWVVYWLALAVAVVIPPLLAHFRIHPVSGEHETFTASFGDGVFSASLKYFDTVRWSGSIHFLAVALWVAGPPLALFVAWLAARRRERRAAAPIGV